MTPDWAEFILARVGSEFDSECHLTEDEAWKIAQALIDLVAENRKLTEQYQRLLTSYEQLDCKHEEALIRLVEAKKGRES